MNVNFDTPLLSALASKTLGPTAKGVGGLGDAAAAAGTGQVGFANALDAALKGVSNAQNEAQALQRQFQIDSNSVSLEETMVAMQKSQVAFQAALTVRNRLVSAYTDIMNMQV